jgi:hypothetical protein
MYDEVQTKNSANHPHYFKLIAVVDLFVIVFLNVNYTNANTIAIQYTYILRCKIWIRHNMQATSRL